jgi:hypothetical protein
MSSWDKASDWVRMLVGYSIAFIVLVILRTVILSLHGVRDLGFVVYPFKTMAYPMGLLGIQLLDMLFRTVFIFVVLALGGSLNRVLSSTFPRVTQLGRIASLGMGLGALIIGYYAYMPLLLPPLVSQGAEWAYSLIFWVFAAGILAFVVFEFARMVSAVAATGNGKIELTSSTRRTEEVQRASCVQCSQPLLPGARYCFSCGAPATESETQRAADGLTSQPTRPEVSQEPGAQTANAPASAAVDERVIRLMRTTAPGATGKQMLGQLLEIDAEYEPYKALLVTFASPPPEARKIRYLAIPTSRPMDATALDVVGPEAVASWDRMALEGLAILVERSGKQ